MNSAQCANQALLDVLSLSHLRWETELSVHCKPGQFPTVTATLCPTTLPTGGASTRRFSLIAEENALPSRPIFDLDALCDQARQRVANSIALSVGTHYLAMANQAKARRARNPATAKRYRDLAEGFDTQLIEWSKGAAA